MEEVAGGGVDGDEASDSIFSSATRISGFSVGSGAIGGSTGIKGVEMTCSAGGGAGGGS